MTQVAECALKELSIFQFGSDARFKKQRQDVSHLLDACLQAFNTYHSVIQV